MSDSTNTKITSFDNLPLFMSVEETASVLGICRTNAYDFVRRGTIRSVRMGKRFLIPKDALKELAESAFAEPQMVK